MLQRWRVEILKGENHEINKIKKTSRKLIAGFFLIIKKREIESEIFPYLHFSTLNFLEFHS